MHSFGTRLRSLRLASGLSQEEVGLELGVSKAAVSGWELDRSQPPIDTLVAIKRLFTRFDPVSLDWLLDNTVSAQALLDSINRIQDGEAGYQVDESRATNARERQLLMRYRRMSLAKQKALLELLRMQDDAPDAA